MLGEVIHGYRIERALSEDKGGFGDVFFATHVDSGAEAVVKVLKPEMSARRDIVARFFNEARAAASVHHPGIVQIHNVGYHGDRAYLLMERLRGSDLEARLAAGPLPVERAVVFMRQAAGAVGAAHDRGIVHRDLKPANLFVVADPDVVGGERVKVLDFGIAKLTAEAGAGQTQGVFGTPAYMSPEQCASTGAVDARADLYSLGCIFYELVCGRPPFGHGGLELIAAQLRDTPPPPRAIAPWLPPPIEQVILGLLEKQPERRIPSCAALIAALDGAVRAAGLPGGSVPHLPAAAGPAASMPRPASGDPGTGAMHPTTLGSASGGVAAPIPKRSVGVWLGIGAVVAVAGAMAAILAMPRHPPPDSRAGSGGSGGSAEGSAAVSAKLEDAGIVIAASPDAGPLPDAGQVAIAISDAAVVQKPDDTAGSEPSASDSRRPATVQAQRRFDEGRKLIQAGKLAAACAAFETSQKLDPEIATLLGLADCREQNHQLATAWGRFVEANRMARSAGNDMLASIATSHARKLEPRLSRLTIAVPADHQVPGLAVLRGAAPVGPASWNHALPVDGGSYTITARAPGREPWSTTTTIKVESDARTVEIPRLAEPRLSAAPAPAAPTPAAPSPAAPTSQAEIAAKLNEEGKNLMYADRYSDAAKKFQEVVARAPEAKYFVNLCTARIQEGKLDEALTACHAVALHNPTPDVQGRANKLINVIKEEARKQNLELH